MSENLVNILKILVEKQGIDCLYNSQTWRYVTTEKGGSKWSRMSEKLPWSRVLYLTILLILWYKNIPPDGKINWKPGDILTKFPIEQNKKI